MICYHQRTGQLYEVVWPFLPPLAIGYSGHGLGKNAPGLEDHARVGPIPQGLYFIGPPRDTPDHGPFVLPLDPCPGTDTHGRSGFLIHGDSKEHPGEASLGCIILPRPIREQIVKHQFLVVLPGEPALTGRVA
jgi:hypothetical protein